MLVLITQKISNSKIFEEVERTINVVGIHMNSDASTFDLYYRISYSKNGEDITQMFNSQVPTWHIDNSQTMMVRDENFNPIQNPCFQEKRDDKGKVINENERFITMPAFDYIKMLMLDTNVPMKDILQAYIAEEDEEGRFNF